MHLLLLPLTLTLLAVLPLRAQAGSWVVAEAGSLVHLPCNLMGPSLRWDWLPRYPRCAGVSSELQTIYTETADGARQVSLQRFQTRLRHRMDPGTRTSILELQPARMTDSGTFICASPSQEGLPVWVIIAPGCQTGAFIGATPQTPKEGEAVSLSCIPCGEEGPMRPPKGETTWLFNGKQPPASSVRILWSRVTIETFSRKFEGLWSCHLPGDPQQTATYCLEPFPEVHGTQGSPSPSPTPAPFNPGFERSSRSWLNALAGRCALTFLFLSASIGAICYVHQKARPSHPTGASRNETPSSQEPHLH